MVGSYTLGELCNRYYKRTENGKGTTFVSLKDLLFKTADPNWFVTPDRGAYMSQLSTIFDDFLKKEEFKDFAYFLKFSWEQMYMRLDEAQSIQNRVNDDYMKAWSLLKCTYPTFRNKINEILIENGIVQDEQEISTIMAKYHGRINERLPECYSKEEKEDLITFLIIYLTIVINFMDIYGRILLSNIDYFEYPGFYLNYKIMLNGEISERLINVLSSEDMYILKDYPSLFGMPKDEEEIRKVFEILRKVEEDFTPPTMTLVNSEFRDTISKGFILKMIIDSSKISNGESLHDAFVLMRQGVGEMVVRMIRENPSNKRSYTRKELEEILVDWWEQFKAESSFSYPRAEKRISDFKDRMKKENVKMEIASSNFVSPSKLRVTFLNQGLSSDEFLRNINTFIGEYFNYKANISQGGGLQFNRMLDSGENNLIKFVDIRVYP